MPKTAESVPDSRYAEPVPNEIRSRKLVAAGLIIRENQILITQRAAGQAMPHKWEFPGGKLEAGESPEAALQRELAEEIGVTVSVGDIWQVLFHAYSAFDLLMLVYPCRIFDESVLCCLEVADMAWVLPAEMSNYEILEADRPLIEKLINEGVPTF